MDIIFYGIYGGVVLAYISVRATSHASQKRKEGMKPIKFKEVNRLLKGKDSTIGDLPVFTEGIRCLSCWRMSFREKLKALIYGRIWLCVLTHKTTQPPVWIHCDRNGFEKEGKDERIC